MEGHTGHAVSGSAASKVASVASSSSASAMSTSNVSNSLSAMQHQLNSLQPNAASADHLVSRWIIIISLYLFFCCSKTKYDLLAELKTSGASPCSLQRLVQSLKMPRTPFKSSTFRLKNHPTWSLGVSPPIAFSILQKRYPT